MSLRIGSQAPSLPAGDEVVDVFSNKVGNWAYKGLFPSFKNTVSEIFGRFAIRPKGGDVMTYLEAQVAQARELPCGSMYDDALRAAMAELGDYPSALAVLEGDIEMRDYFRARRMEQVFS